MVQLNIKFACAEYAMSTKTVSETREFWRAIGLGALAGTFGTVAMTFLEKLEQKMTGRPNSYIPAYTAERLLGLKEPKTVDGHSELINLGMHFFNGIFTGAPRGMASRAGLRGLKGSLFFSIVRFSFDEILENATAVGAPPWQWPLDEQLIDIFHKSSYSLITGALADRFIHPVDRELHPEIWELIARQSPLVKKAA